MAIADYSRGREMENPDMRKPKSIKAYVLVHKKSGRVLPDGGISFDRTMTEPDPIYSEEYGVLAVDIPLRIEI